MTRVAHSGNSTTFVTGDRISVYAWTGSADAVPSAFVVDNSINTLGGDGTWTAEPQMLWADNTSDHHFLGIYPERDVITDYNADPYTSTPITRKRATCWWQKPRPSLPFLQ